MAQEAPKHGICQMGHIHPGIRIASGSARAWPIANASVYKSLAFAPAGIRMVYLACHHQNDPAEARSHVAWGISNPSFCGANVPQKVGGRLENVAGARDGVGPREQARKTSERLSSPHDAPNVA